MKDVISIHPMLFFIQGFTVKAIKGGNFNTSYVIFYLDMLSYDERITNISIHPMLFFIQRF